MELERYPWLIDVWHGWQQSLLSQRIPGALLLKCAPNMAVEKLVDFYARTLLCTHQGSEPCGFCHSCELMKSGSHPDMHYIVPEKSARTISVEQIRQCNRIAQQSSQLNGYRLFVIQPAELMTTAAANALLKTLEEPGERCVFLLVSYQPESLLTTIVSRCQQWHIQPPDTDMAAAWLQKETGLSVPGYAFKLNGYSPLAAQVFVQNGELEQYQQLESILVKLCRGESHDVAALLALLKTDSLQRLHWLWYLLADAQKGQFGLWPSDALPASKQLAELNYQGLCAAQNKLQNIIELYRLTPGLNIELLVTNWVIEIREELCI